MNYPVGAYEKAVIAFGLTTEKAGFVIQKRGTTRGIYGTEADWTDSGQTFDGRLSVPLNRHGEHLGATSQIVTERFLEFAYPVGIVLSESERIRRLADNSVYDVVSIKGPQTGLAVFQMAFVKRSSGLNSA